MNAVHLIGTVKFAPKLNTFTSGKAKASALIACETEGRNYPDNVDVAAWEDQAMALADLKQGDAVEIHGRCTTESWDDKATGQKRYKMLVIAETVASPSRTVREATATAQAAGRFDGESPAARQQREFARTGPARQTAGAGTIEEDDIPF